MSAVDGSLREQLLEVADVLIPPSATMPGLRTVDPDGAWLDRAAAARPDLLDRAPAVLARLRDRADLEAALRELFGSARPDFDTVATLVAGAYFMVPEIRSRIGYPGPRRHPATVDEAADDLADIIDQAAGYRRRDPS